MTFNNGRVAMKGMRNIAPIGVRIPDDLKEKVQQKAKENGRSMNAEIIHIIEESINGIGSDKTDSSQEEYINQLISIISVQKESIDLAKEQIALLRQQIKIITGFDLHEYLKRMADDDESSKKDKENKKPT